MAKGFKVVVITRVSKYRDIIKSEGFFHAGPIRQKWSEHLSGNRNWQYHLWDVLMFQSWLENQ